MFSLKQQRIVAETKGAAVYIDAKTGRPVEMRTLGGGWPKVYEAFTKKSEAANKLKEQWESEMSETSGRATSTGAKNQGEGI